MHTTVVMEAGAPPVIDVVDFKWLMAGLGHRVDVKRLQHDTAYARACLSLAAGSPEPMLRRAAERLERVLHTLPDTGPVA